MSRGLCKDCTLRLDGICEEWGEDPTCRKWSGERRAPEAPTQRSTVKQGTYPTGTKQWERRG